jgi:hypothetical protein
MTALVPLGEPRSALAIARARADGWAADAAPLIRAWLDLGPLLDRLEPACCFFGRPDPAGEAANQAWFALDHARAALHARIGACRDAAIDRAHPLHRRPASRFDEGEAADIADALVADTIGVAEAIAAVARGGEGAR